MIKMAAITVIVLGAGLLGVTRASQLKKRIILLEGFLCMILELKGQINYFREPLMNINIHMREKADSEAFILLERVCHDLREKEAQISKIWAQKTKEIYNSSALEEEDIKLFCYAGTFIGQTDFENQLARFQHLERRLGEQINSAKENYNRKGPLYRKIGFLAGGITAIIFI